MQYCAHETYIVLWTNVSSKKKFLKDRNAYWKKWTGFISPLLLFRLMWDYRTWWSQSGRERQIPYDITYMWKDVVYIYSGILKVEVAQPCPTLCDPMHYTVRGILQARILERVAFPFSRGSSPPKDQTQVSRIAGRFFTSWATRQAQESWSG